MPTLRRLAQLLVVVALLTGCDSVSSQPELTKQEAVALVEARAREAFDHLPAGATLKEDLRTLGLPCSDLNRDRVFAEISYTIDYPAGWPIGQSMRAVADYWAAKQYRFIRDDRQNDAYPQLVVEHPGDEFHIGYQLTYRNNGRIDAYLTSSSTCFQKED